MINIPRYLKVILFENIHAHLSGYKLVMLLLP